MMSFTLRTFAVALALSGSALTAGAQESGSTARTEPVTTKTFYFANTNEVRDEVEIRTALSDAMGLPATTSTPVTSENALIVRASPSQLVTAERIFHDLDRPRKSYRLTYAITESDRGKQIGIQHCSLILAEGGRTTLKQGSKVPVGTGSFDQGKGSTQTQFTYLDVGLNIDVSIDPLAQGVRLKSKVEQSSIAEEKSTFGAAEPIVRQIVLESTSILLPGKPSTLGSLDVPGSTRHLEIEVTMEPVK
jgi:type II secretory pathway component GspD/PulD (secretin)